MLRYLSFVGSMKVCLILCLATVAISAPLALEEEWQQWKQQHGKSYSNEVEESMRRVVWFRTFHHIQEHNNDASNLYQLGLNSLADMVSLSFLHVTEIYSFFSPKDS